MRKTENEIKDIIITWAIRKQILLGFESINDLAKEIVRQESL